MFEALAHSILELQKKYLRDWCPGQAQEKVYNHILLGQTVWPGLLSTVDLFARDNNLRQQEL